MALHLSIALLVRYNYRFLIEPCPGTDKKNEFTDSSHQHSSSELRATHSPVLPPPTLKEMPRVLVSRLKLPEGRDRIVRPLGLNKRPAEV